MKIGIYGGAFNPVHNEHIKLAISAKKSLNLDKLIIIPSYISPHKIAPLSALPEVRLSWCRQAFEGIGEVSSYECDKGGVSYSYLTCRHFKEIYPDDELIFIMGADMLASFKNWKLPQEILKCVNIAVCAREDGKALERDIKEFERQFFVTPKKIDFVGGKVSSTKIRTLSALGEDIKNYVPECVNLAILGGQSYYLSEIDGVKNYLTNERWAHTVRVAVFAAENCRRAGVSEKDAVVAAALHDCAKYIPKDSNLLNGFVMPEQVPPPVVHQYTGAFVAEHTFGIKDSNILNAVRYHTSGRPNMSALEKLIFLADMLEEGRNFEGVEYLRSIFKEDIDKALFAALEHQLNYLKSTGKPVYGLTERAYEYLKSTLK